MLSFCLRVMNTYSWVFTMICFSKCAISVKLLKNVKLSAILLIHYVIYISLDVQVQDVKTIQSFGFFLGQNVMLPIQSRPIEMRILHRNERCSKACSAHFAPAAYFTAAILFFLPFCEWAKWRTKEGLKSSNQGYRGGLEL